MPAKEVFSFVNLIPILSAKDPWTLPMEKKKILLCQAAQVNTEFWAVNPIQHAEWLIQNNTELIIIIIN